MHGPLQLGVKHAEDRRVELEHGKADGQRGNEFRHEARMLKGVRFLVVFFQRVIRQLLMMVVGRHTNSALSG